MKNDLVYSCAFGNVKAWSIQNQQIDKEFVNNGHVYDMFLGREETPLAGQIVLIGHTDNSCDIFNIETGVKLNTINIHNCHSVAVDKAQSLIAVGSSKKVTFIQTNDFEIIKEVELNDVCSLAFNKRNDCMLAVTRHGEIYSFKF